MQAITVKQGGAKGLALIQSPLTQLINLNPHDLVGIELRHGTAGVEHHAATNILLCAMAQALEGETRSVPAFVAAYRALDNPRAERWLSITRDVFQDTMAEALRPFSVRAWETYKKAFRTWINASPVADTTQLPMETETLRHACRLLIACCDIPLLGDLASLFLHVLDLYPDLAHPPSPALTAQRSSVVRQVQGFLATCATGDVARVKAGLGDTIDFWREVVRRWPAEYRPQAVKRVELTPADLLALWRDLAPTQWTLYEEWAACFRHLGIDARIVGRQPRPLVTR